MNSPVLICNGLKKSYKKKKYVLEGLNLSLPAGRIIGLLGPNGCGKSTLLKLICGLLMPDEGEISICGEARSELSNRYISYLPERTYLDPGQSVEEILWYFSEFFSDFDENAAREMLAKLEIDPRRKIRVLSKGTREKVQLVMAMARRAKLYLLDEPIAGVDPAARDYILQTIISNYHPDATVLITTHLIYDVEPILDDFIFMGQGGKILLGGNADEVRAQHGKSLDLLFKEVFRC